jgi:hypothetical protein
MRHFDDTTTRNQLIDMLGAMLPFFGFVVLPIVVTMLHNQPMVALQVANVVGFIYGGVITYLPDHYCLQILIVFPAGVTSMQEFQSECRFLNLSARLKFPYSFLYK